MKILIVLPCLLATVLSVSIPDRNQQREWTYNYEGQINSVIPSLSHKTSGLGIKAQVHFSPATSDKIQMRMENIRVANFNQRFPGPFSKKFQKLHYETSREMSNALQMPIYFKRVDGLVKIIDVDKNDELWAINVKKAIVSLTNLNKTVLHRIMTTSGDDYSSEIVNEAGIEGICATDYSVYPPKQGPMHQKLQSRQQQQQGIIDDEIVQVTKVRLLDQCDKRAIIIDSTPTVEYCQDCGSKSQDKLVDSASIQYKLRKNDLAVQSLLAEGETIIPKLGEHSVVVSSIQKLELIPTPRVIASIYSEERSGQNEQSKTTIMAAMPYFLPIDAQEQDISLPGVNKTEIDENSLNPHKQTYLLQNHGETSASVYATRESIPKIVQIIKMSLWKLKSEVTKNGKQMAESSYDSLNAPISIRNLASYTSYLSYNDLNNLYGTLDRTTKPIERKIFLDVVSMAGTGASVKFLRNLTEQNHLKSYEAFDVVSGLQESVILPNLNAISELTAFCKIRSLPDLVHASVCISLGQILRKACQAPKRLLITPRPLLPLVCKPEKLNRTIDELANKLRSEQTENKKAIYIEALGHTGHLRAMEAIKPYLRKEGVSKDQLRIVAINNLRHVAQYHPQQVLKLVLPIYNNRQESEDIRITAVSVAFAAQPPLPVMEKLAVDLKHETNNQVGSFVYTSLQALANSTAPCVQALALNASKVIQLASTFPIQTKASFRKLVDLVDVSNHVQILGDAEILTSKKYHLPKTGSLRLSTTTAGQLLNEIFEAKFSFQNGLETVYKSLIKSESVDSQNDDQSQHNGVMSLRLFERTLFMYITDSNAQGIYSKVLALARDFVQHLRTKGEVKYVKAALPLKSNIITPSQMGLAVTYFHSTETVVALRMKNFQFSEHSVTGSVTPYIRHENADVIAVFNPVNLTLASTGNFIRSSAQVEMQVTLQNSTEKSSLTVQPNVTNSYVYQSSKPFTGIVDIRSAHPLYDTPAETTPIDTNRKPFIFRQVVGKDLLGLGLKLRGYTENPWFLNTGAWLKTIQNPFKKLPGTLWTIIVNPWLYKRQIMATLEPEFHTEQPIQIKFETETVNKNSVLKTLSKLHYGKQISINRTLNATIKVQKSDESVKRQVVATSRVHYNETHLAVNLTAGTVKITQGLRSEKNVSMNVTVHTVATVQQEERPLASQEEVGVQKVYELRMLNASYYDSKSGQYKRIDISGQVKKEVKAIWELQQPKRALAYEVKKRCEREVNEFEQRSVNHYSKDVQFKYKPSRVCQLALQDKASIAISDYTVTSDVKVDRVTQYVKQILYPYQSVKNVSWASMPSNVTQVVFDTLEGIKLTSVTTKDSKNITVYENIYLGSKILNDILAMPSMPLSQAKNAGYRTCKMDASVINTFDNVKIKNNAVVSCPLTLMADENEHIVITYSKTLRNEFVLNVTIAKQHTVIIKRHEAGERKPRVLINGQPFEVQLETGSTKILQLNQRTQTVEIHGRHEKDQTVRLNFKNLGIKIKFDLTKAEIKIPSALIGETSGLCGNNNGEQAYELRGQNNCVYTNVQDFILSHQRPHSQCQMQQWSVPQACKEVMPRPGSPQAETIIYRNKVVKTSKSICFSTEPQPKCVRGSIPDKMNLYNVEYHCLPSNSRTAQALERRAETEQLHNLRRKQVDYSKMEELPVICKPNGQQ